MEESPTRGEILDDPIRDKLLDAAAQVFADKGYLGTKIMDVIKAAGLSSGAIYGRFQSKDELLMEAVVASVRKNALSQLEARTVADALVEMTEAHGPLTNAEATQLEAFVAARREAAVAAAIEDARQAQWGGVIEPLIRQAIVDGTADAEADFDSIVYFVQTLHLGLLVQRGAGQAPPDREAWRRFTTDLFRTMARTSVTKD